MILNRDSHGFVSLQSLISRILPIMNCTSSHFCLNCCTRLHTRLPTQCNIRQTNNSQQLLGPFARRLAGQLFVVGTSKTEKTGSLLSAEKDTCFTYMAVGDQQINQLRKKTGKVQALTGLEPMTVGLRCTGSLLPGYNSNPQVTNLVPRVRFSFGQHQEHRLWPLSR